MAIETSTTTTVTRPSTAASVGLFLLRLPLGAYFIVASIGKMAGDGGISAFVEKTLPMARNFMPEHLARIYLGSLPWVELGVGIFLIAGLLTRVIALVVSLLLISFTIALGASAAFGQIAPGVRLPFHPNLVYLGSALAIMLCGPGWISLDGLIFRPRRRVVIEDIEQRVAP